MSSSPSIVYQKSKSLVSTEHELIAQVNATTLANCKEMRGNDTKLPAMMGGTTFGGVGQRWIFVRGLHHGGITLTAKLLSLSPDVATVQPGHHQDEGQYAQGVFPFVAKRSARAAQCNGDIYRCPGLWNRALRAGAQARLTLWGKLCEAWLPHARRVDERRFVVERDPDLTVGYLSSLADPSSAFLLVMRHPLFWHFDFGSLNEASKGSMSDGGRDRGRAHSLVPGKAQCARFGQRDCVLLWIDVWVRTILDLTQNARTGKAIAMSRERRMRRRRMVHNTWAIVRFESMMLRPPQETLAAVSTALNLGEDFVERYPFDNIVWHKTIYDEENKHNGVDDILRSKRRREYIHYGQPSMEESRGQDVPLYHEKSADVNSDKFSRLEIKLTRGTERELPMPLDSSGKVEIDPRQVWRGENPAVHTSWQMRRSDYVTSMDRQSTAKGLGYTFKSLNEDAIFRACDDLVSMLAAPTPFGYNLTHFEDSIEIWGESSAVILASLRDSSAVLSEVASQVEMTTGLRLDNQDEFFVSTSPTFRSCFVFKNEDWASGTKRRSRLRIRTNKENESASKNNSNFVTASVTASVNTTRIGSGGVVATNILSSTGEDEDDFHTENKRGESRVDSASAAEFTLQGIENSAYITSRDGLIFYWRESTFVRPIQAIMFLLACSILVRSLSLQAQGNYRSFHRDR